MKAKRKRKAVLLTPVGKIKKGLSIKTIFDIGHRLPGDIPVLYTRKDKPGKNQQ